MYRLVDLESDDVLLTAEEVCGFFVDPSQEPPVTVTFRQARPSSPTRRRTEETQLEVVSQVQETIGSYYLGRTSAVDPERHPGSVSEHGVPYDFFGYTCEFPWAGKVWRRWSSRSPLRYDEWTRYPVECHESWLHVVQTSWFTLGREATRYGVDGTVLLDGAKMTTRAGFYCALGEAVNGPGGYFGSNLDALADCLARSREAPGAIRIIWRADATSREALGGEFVDNVTAVLREFGSEVTFPGR